MGQEDREIDQKMVKAIERMPENIRKRFKYLNVLTAERDAVYENF